MDLNRAYLASSPSSIAVLSAHWCLVGEFFCCTDRAKGDVEVGREAQIQHRPARGLSLMCIRMNVVVELGGLMLVVDVLNVLDAVMDSARIRYLFEVGSSIVQAGNWTEELDGRRA